MDAAADEAGGQGKGQADDGGWLLLIHQLPPKPAYLRVKVGRRLQRIGAVALKSTVYVLPRRAGCYEDLQWLRGEILADAGEATICEARFLDGHADSDVVALFAEARDAEYRALCDEVKPVLDSVARVGSEAEAPARLASDLARFRRRLQEIEEIDFFGAPLRSSARDALASLQAQVEGLRPRTTTAMGAPLSRYRRRTWVTREHMHVDRLASAWLVKRFVDPDATLKLVPARGYRPKDGEILFDMFEQQPGPDGRFELFTHEGDLCTFEVLVAKLGLSDPGLRALAEIVHELDVKDGRHGRPEAPGFEALVNAVCFAHADDDARLSRTGAMLDDLYALYSREERGEP